MLRAVVIAAFVLSVSTANALTINPIKPPNWRQLQRADPNETIQLTIGLKQSNSDRLFDQLMDVSDPRSKNYGKHWSIEQINDYVRPAGSTQSVISDWLISNGINSSLIQTTQGGEWLSMILLVDQVESLLHTEYYEYQHISGLQVLRSINYNVPDDISQHIDVIGPTTRFPAIKPMMKSKKSINKSIKQHRHARSIDANSCASSGTTPDCLRSRYTMGDASASSGKSTVAVTGFLEEYISLTDLSSFYSQYDKNSTGRTPTVVGSNNSSNPGMEASLDIQYMSAMAHGSEFSFIYTAGRSPKNPDNEPFLMFVQTLSNQTTVPFVISTSYGDDEDSVDVDYAKRLGQEFSKLGLRGVSVVFSSGDSGAGCNANGDKYMPTLPSSLPSVTSVGATFWDGSFTSEKGAIFSSGGFSNLFSMPSYQVSAVQSYLKTYASSMPPASFYNQTGRATPDVSVLGEAFVPVVNGENQLLDGTSCSTPTFAGMLATLNDLRFKAGKSPLGFINPLIYQHPEVFNDITTGLNSGCNDRAFLAEKGWDAITGLGTPNYSALQKLIGSL